MAGDAIRWLGGDIYTSTFVSDAMLLAADLDGNGFADLIMSNYHVYTVFRNTHGNPPLLANLALAPAFAIGGVSTTGIVQLGGVASANGAVVTLTTSDPALASFPSGTTVVIPAGTSSATFAIAMNSVVQRAQRTAAR